MSEARFTGGEWIVYDGDLRYCKGKVCIIEPDDMPTVIADLNDYFGKDAREANAHLIAASPAMYKEIEGEIEWLERLSKKYVIGSYELQGVLSRIQRKRELLAKARGQ